MLQDFKLGEPYTESPDWIKNKKATTNQKIKMIDVFVMRQQLRKMLGKLKKTHKEFEILSHLWISITGMEWNTYK